MAENYSTYTYYYESGGDFCDVNSATSLSCIGNRSKKFCLLKDKGAAHFSGDFEHLLSVVVNTDSNPSDRGICTIWGLSNDTSAAAHDFNVIDAANGDGLFINAEDYTSSKVVLWLRELDSGTIYQDLTNPYRALNTRYYLEVERDEGTGTYGTLLCRLYSDSARTNLLDTLSLTLHEKQDFRNIYACASHHATSYTTDFDVDVDALDLQEAGTPEWYYRRLRGAA